MTKGSFTVEAAFLMPLVCTVLVLLLYLGVHVQNRAILTARAYEEAIMETQLENLKLFGADTINRIENFEKIKNEVTYETNTTTGWGGWNWSLRVGGIYEKCDPVAFIRKCQVGRLLVEGIQES